MMNSRIRAGGTERWRQIQGFDGYEVSDLGRVRSIRCVLSGCVGSSGYVQVVLYRDKRRFNRLIHRLVLESFVGECPDGLECLHDDGDRTNNSLSNLCWGTRSENEKAKIHHGTVARGESHGNSKLTADDVVEIRSSDVSQRKLANLFGVSQQHIQRIKSGECWGWL